MTELSKELQELIDGAEIEDEETWNEITERAVKEVESKEVMRKESGERFCVKCKATANVAKLCYVLSGKIVPEGTAGAVTECLDTADCYARESNSSRWYKADCTSGGGHYSTQQYVQKCRHEATEAFELDGVHYFGGSESKVANGFFDQDKWMVVSLLGKSYNTSSPLWCKLPNWFNLLRPYTMAPQISIDWPDMGIPPLRPGFWNRIAALAKQEGFTNVLFYCIGGHGRTGTALCSVLVECAELTPKDAITYVRKMYCKEAVESPAQTGYLEALHKYTNQAQKQKKSDKSSRTKKEKNTNVK